MRELWAKRDQDAKEKVHQGRRHHQYGGQAALHRRQKPVYDKFVTTDKMKDLVAKIKATQ